MTVPSSWRLSEPQETVAKALVRAAKVGEERIALCVATWYGWEFPDCGKATAIPPVDAGQASWFVTSLFFQYFLFISKYRRLSTECPIGGVKNDIIGKRGHPRAHMWNQAALMQTPSKIPTRHITHSRGVSCSCRFYSSCRKYCRHIRERR
jgi:hypothetical protein